MKLMNDSNLRRRMRSQRIFAEDSRQSLKSFFVTAGDLTLPINPIMYVGSKNSGLWGWNPAFQKRTILSGPRQNL